MIDTQRVKQIFMDLLRINSPSKQEREVADYVKVRLQGLGFEVEEDNTGEEIGGNAGNVIAFRKGTVPGAKSIFLSCHMDTVEPTDKLNVIVDDTEIRSDGSTILGADDKAGIAAVIEAVTSITEEGASHGDIQILFDVSEEVGLQGARALDRSKIRAKIGFVFDTQKPVAGITVSAPSHENISVTITGKAAHAGIAPEQGVSAIVAASRAIAKMKLGRIDEETTANIGVIEGGKARNIVPDMVRIRAEARSRNNEKLAAQVAHMKRVFEEEASAIGARAEVRSEKEYSTFRFSKDDEVVKLAMAASRKIGIEPTFQDGGGGSDANVFNSAGIPAVVIGVGYDGAHSPSERIAIADLSKAAEYAAALIECAAEVRE